MKSIFNFIDMKLLLLMFIIGLGVFNAISTSIDQILELLIMEETGLVGGQNNRRCIGSVNYPTNF